MPFCAHFDCLENLSAKGAVRSLTSVIHQSNLKHLCLHEIEGPDRKRKPLDAEQINLKSALPQAYNPRN
jgi:hypothetical protein